MSLSLILQYAYSTHRARVVDTQYKTPDSRASLAFFIYFTLTLGQSLFDTNPRSWGQHTVLKVYKLDYLVLGLKNILSANIIYLSLLRNTFMALQQFSTFLGPTTNDQANCLGLSPPLTPKFKRRGPFRYFDLPAEIRCMILDLVLAPGHVALSPRIRTRFPLWSHERPAWELFRVSHRMRDEAKARFRSKKNIFYLPVGEMGDFVDWAHRTMDALPLIVKNLDCAFDKRDLIGGIFSTLNMEKAAKLDPVRKDFERPVSRTQEWYSLHSDNTMALLKVWREKIDAFKVLNLDLLRLDLSSCQCLWGCCRPGKNLLRNLTFDIAPSYYGQTQTVARYPRRIEIIGALLKEENMWRKAIERSSEVPVERVFFVGAPGRT